ncbi:Hypothetical predicted protein, partial [Paramuricea clavata]
MPLNFESVKALYLNIKGLTTAVIYDGMQYVTDNTHSAKNGVHALFIDFRKAFDLVDHGILL